MIRSALIALAVIFLLLLNLANLFGMIGLSGPVPAMIWFAISFCGGFLSIQILRRKASHGADRNLCRSLRGRIFHERFVLRIF